MGVYTEQLVKVPWFVVKSDTRRTITEEQPVSNEKQTEELVDQRLQALGYK